MLFFVRRRWANRVTADMDLPARAPETTLLVELLIWAGKQMEQDAKRGTGNTLKKEDGVLRRRWRWHRTPPLFGR